jgi:hypothetical protein
MARPRDARAPFYFVKSRIVLGGGGGWRRRGGSIHCSDPAAGACRQRRRRGSPATKDQQPAPAAPRQVVGVDDSDGVYFVLHYIPDMHWCHLVPMRPEGVFPPRLKWVPRRRRRRRGRACGLESRRVTVTALWTGGRDSMSREMIMEWARGITYVDGAGGAWRDTLGSSASSLYWC